MLEFITASAVGKRVDCLVGCKGYGVGVLESVNGDQAYVKLEKVKDRMDDPWRKCDQVKSVYAGYVSVAK